MNSFMVAETVDGWRLLMGTAVLDDAGVLTVRTLQGQIGATQLGSMPPRALATKLLREIYLLERITTNLTFAKWSSVFGDAEMTTALLDRFRYISLST